MLRWMGLAEVELMNSPSLSASLSASTRAWVRACACTFVRACAWPHAYVCVRVRACVCICMCICAHMAGVCGCRGGNAVGAGMGTVLVQVRVWGIMSNHDVLCVWAWAWVRVWCGRGYGHGLRNIADSGFARHEWCRVVAKFCGKLGMLISSARISPFDLYQGNPLNFTGLRIRRLIFISPTGTLPDDTASFLTTEGGTEQLRTCDNVVS